MPARIFPARAGNTPVSCGFTTVPTDHPRTGGEHAYVAVNLDGFGGSSPHGRGTRRSGRRCRGPRRIIPARAGNTSAPAPAPAPRPDHPRTGGEHASRPLIIRFDSGSSPHGRGTREGNPQVGLRLRIIPARAGNTGPAGRASRRPADHPRTGGEHTAAEVPVTTTTGSSPHGRGTLHLWPPPLPDGRIIPARAGNTTLRAFAPAVLADHPRTGGEHGTIISVGLSSFGSSPHGRGTLVNLVDDAPEYRIIPARAGNTLC